MLEFGDVGQFAAKFDNVTVVGNSAGVDGGGFFLNLINPSTSNQLDEF